MRRLLMLIAALFIASLSFAAFPVASPAESKVAEPEEQQVSVQAEDAINMSAKEYERLRGKKMNVIERLIFRVEEKRLINELKKGGANSDFNWPGFIFGLLLGPYAMLGALIFSRSKNFKRSVWAGFKIWLLVFFIVMLVIFGKAAGRLR